MADGAAPDLPRDELARAQLVRTAGYAPFDGADLGDCLAVAGRLSGARPGPWYDAWTATAERLLHEADRSRAAGDVTGERSACFRASNYFRTAGVLLLGAPVDPRLERSHAREVEAFGRAARLLPIPPEPLDVTYDGGVLHCSFFRAGTDGRPRSTLILLGGYDGTAEELWFANGVAAHLRGYHVLTFDGPGQGGALLDEHVPMRPDWEHVVTPVVDALLARSDVDGDAIVLMGLSLGGYLAPRAASAEHRIAACVSDCGPYDVADAAARRLPRVLRPALDATKGRRLDLLRRALRALLRRPGAGWALRRNLLVHGLDDPVEWFREARRFTLRGREAEIACPTFVCTTDRDELSSAAPVLYDALTCPKRFVRFATADGAGDHCEAAARSRFHDSVFAWLQEVLPHAPVTG